MHELKADAPALMDPVVESSPYAVVRFCHYYCFQCRSLERQAATAAGVPLDSDAGLHGAHVTIGRN